MLEAKDVCHLLCREHETRLHPVVVDLKTISLHPTAYSLRWGGVYEPMTDWNFEASVDGKIWETLHAARDEEIAGPSEEEVDEIYDIVSYMSQADKISKFLLDYVERNHRHYFPIVDQENAVFYRYFRFTGCNDSPSPLQGVGLELYGHVHEK